MTESDSSRHSSNAQYPYLLNSNDSNDSFIHSTSLDANSGDSMVQPFNYAQKKCLIIYTGGTLGMRCREDGALAPSQGYLTSLMADFYEFKQPGMPDITVHEWDPLLDSSDFEPAEWIKIAQAIQDNYLDYDGFVVIHGTDTMAYTSSALSFMLENLAKPVILTGSQIPIEQVYNDAKRNLIVSILLSVRNDIPEVAVCFDGALFRGNRVTKIDNWGSHPFASPNYPPLAILGTQVKLGIGHIRVPPRYRFRIHTNMATNVLVVQLVPSFDDSIIEIYIKSSEKPRGLVLLLYGSGNAPSRRIDLVKVLGPAKEQNVEIVVCSQCRYGSVNLDSYASGKQLVEHGVINGKDMTVESCVTKLAYLMGSGFRGETLKRLMESNLRGEISNSQKNYSTKYLPVIGNPSKL